MAGSSQPKETYWKHMNLLGSSLMTPPDSWVELRFLITRLRDILTREELMTILWDETDPRYVKLKIMRALIYSLEEEFSATSFMRRSTIFSILDTELQKCEYC